MTTKNTTKTSKALVHSQYADKAIPPLMQEYVAWLKAETGFDVDARSVYLSSALRGAFQKSPGNQQRIAQAAASVAAEKAARAERKAAKAAEPKPKPQRKPAAK